VIGNPAQSSNTSITSGVVLALTPCISGNNRVGAAVGADTEAGDAVEWQMSLTTAGLIVPLNTPPHLNLSVVVCCDSSCGANCGSYTARFL
jgi:hypothetical protein